MGRQQTSARHSTSNRPDLIIGEHLVCDTRHVGEEFALARRLQEILLAHGNRDGSVGGTIRQRGGGHEAVWVLLDFRMESCGASAWMGKRRLYMLCE